MTKKDWTAYVSAGSVLVYLAWSMVSAYFDIQQRLAFLERAQQFSHGDVSPFLKE